METLKTGIEAGIGWRPKDRKPHPILARELMTDRLFTLRGWQPLTEGIIQLSEAGYSAAPVLDAAGKVIGVLAEFDCIRVLAGDTFFEQDTISAYTVADAMGKVPGRVSPANDLYEIADRFTRDSVRLLLVMDRSHLVGVIVRRDLLRMMRERYC